MNANRSAGAPLSSPAAAQRCAEGAGLDRGVLAAAQSAMPSIAAAPAINADMITTSAAAFDDPSDTVPNLHSLDGRDPHFNEGEICDIGWLVASEHLSNLTNIGPNIGWDGVCRIERTALHKRCCNPF